ncbi:MAG: PilC/PilY family type IV pilus protein [Pseudoalteromonas distincta]
MKLLTHILPSAVLITALLCSSSYLAADETEIYFARATADNSENKPSANVMIMLDTSASMRNCETGSGATWCNRQADRRITLLQNAMQAILDDTPVGVNIGLGRFGNNGGGLIMVPVMPVNETTKPVFENAVSSINGGQGITSPGNNIMPSLMYTPTAAGYDEMAKYMLGSNTGLNYSGASNNFCAAREEREVCEDIPVYGAPQQVDYCDENLDQCTVVRGDWRSLAYGSICDLNSERCQLGEWSGWSSGRCSGSSTICENTGVWIFSSNRTRRYQERTVSYTVQAQSGTRRECAVESFGSCVDDRDITSGSRYNSPMNMANQCETNHIILFTDGTPNNDSLNQVTLASCSGSGVSNSYSCQQNIARNLYSESNSKGRAVKTHNIGLYMGTGSTFSSMKSVSDAGAGETYSSDSAQSLVEAFQQTLKLISDDARSTAAPGVAVNTLNRFQHLDQLYYSVFKPVESSYWQGNLKRYQLSGGEIRDQNGNPATDTSTGYFREGTSSFWSSTADGPDVLRGGARARLAERKLFYTDAVGGTIKAVDYSNPEALYRSFDALDALSSEQKAQMIQELQTMWGDPLHSVPLMVNYGGADNNYVFVSTNAGMLHAINTQNGNEVSAFMPYEIMIKADQYTVDRQPLTDDNKRQTYGLDGTWTAWRRPGITASAAPSKVYLYGGMRRGGRSYYALDVTNPAEPEMLWQINNETSGFSAMGQTWSTPTLTTIPDTSTANGRRPVLIFGGGYSAEDHDDGAARRANGDRMGNAIYIVDALTGERIWSAATAFAVPSGIAVVDLDLDGVADHLYFGDLGGQIFRVDIDESGSGGHTVAQIAALGGDGANHRRFYDAPAVAYVKNGAYDELYVGIGSGYKAHPLDEEISEGIFVVRDRAAITRESSETLTLDDLANVSDGSVPASNDAGWYYLFDRAGEKVLASPAVFDGKILFTTYSPAPDETQADPCVVSFGQSYLHSVNLQSARPAPVTEWGGDDAGNGSTELARSIVLRQTTPAPTPNFLVDGDGKVIVVVGTEVVGEGDLGDPRLRKRRWMQLPRDEANAIKADAGQGSVEDE